MASIARVAVIGSVNIDDVYTVPHIVLSGETISSEDHAMHPGGKGANQSVALARAGVAVTHVGAVGHDGEWLRDGMARAGVDVAMLHVSEKLPSGRAVIQVSAETHDNAIVLLPGANYSFDATAVVAELGSALVPGDFVVFQNEINTDAANILIEKCIDMGLFVVINPAPCPSSILYSLPNIKRAHVIIVNETEAFSIYEQLELSNMTLTGEVDVQERMRQGTLKGRDLVNFSKQLVHLVMASFPSCYVVCITLGGEGSLVGCRSVTAEGHPTTELTEIPAMSHVKVVDTTAAGDTFVGYFVAGLMRHASQFIQVDLEKKTLSVSNSRSSTTKTPDTEPMTLATIVVESAKLATVAAGIACETKGSIPSIPSFETTLKRTEHGRFWHMFHKSN